MLPQLNSLFFHLHIYSLWSTVIGVYPFYKPRLLGPKVPAYMEGGQGQADPRPFGQAPRFERPPCSPDCLLGVPRRQHDMLRLPRRLAAVLGLPQSLRQPDPHGSQGPRGVDGHHLRRSLVQWPEHRDEGWFRWRNAEAVGRAEAQGACVCRQWSVQPLPSVS